MLFIYECVTFIVCNKNHEEKHTCTDSIYSTMDIQQDGLVSSCLMTLSAQTVYIMPQKYNVYHVGQGNNTAIQLIQ